MFYLVPRSKSAEVCRGVFAKGTSTSHVTMIAFFNLCPSIFAPRSALLPAALCKVHSHTTITPAGLAPFQQVTCTDAPPTLPPGTTSLLVRVAGSSLNIAQLWLNDWLRDFIFSSQGSLATPVSSCTRGASSILQFFSGEGQLRGELSFSFTLDPTTPCDARVAGVVLRVTSSSRFINVAGTYSSSLPGERRIVRNFFSSLQRRFTTDADTSVRVVYKAPYIRLRGSMDGAGGKTSGGDSSGRVTVFVAELRGSASAQVAVRFLQEWANKLQFGSGSGGLLSSPQLPPTSVRNVTNGVHVCMATDVKRFSSGSDLDKSKDGYAKTQYTSCITATARGKKEVEERSGGGRVLIVVSATSPNQRATFSVLKR